MFRCVVQDEWQGVSIQPAERVRHMKAHLRRLHDGLDLVGVDEAGEVAVAHNWPRQLVALLLL